MTLPVEEISFLSSDLKLQLTFVFVFECGRETNK